MKLGGIRDGVVYGTRGRTVGVWGAGAGFEPRGTVPNPRRGPGRVSFEVVTNPLTKRLLAPVTGRYTTAHVWPVGRYALLATVGRYLFRSSDGGWTWRRVRTLPASSGPMGALPTSLCEHDGALYLAEYTLGDDTARILRSEDGGRTWTVYLSSTEHRHFHGVFHDPHGDRLWATAGDADTESAIGNLADGEFRPVGAGSQRWRAVGLAFTPESILWGMDCSFCDPVRVYRLSRDALRDPDPTPVLTVDASVFYLDTLSVDGDTWVVLATAAETGLDSAAPPGARNTCSRHPRVLAASSRTGFETWHELFSFTRRRTLGEYLPGVPAASAYVYLATDPEVGVAVNPFNTARSHGSVLTVGADRLDGDPDRSGSRSTSRDGEVRHPSR